MDEFMSRVRGGASKFDIVINCAGLGAAKMLGKPEDAFPIRG
jgi:hypothetical protein